jgi:hypothetical protein
VFETTPCRLKMRDSQRTAYLADTRIPFLRPFSESPSHPLRLYLLDQSPKSTHSIALSTATRLARQTFYLSLHRNTPSLQHPRRCIRDPLDHSVYPPRLHRCHRILPVTPYRGIRIARSKPAHYRADHPSPDTRHRTRPTPVTLIPSLQSANLPHHRRRLLLLLLREAGAMTNSHPMDLLRYLKVPQFRITM